jgi:hypothetical protein
MTETQPETYVRRVKAEDIAAGQRIVTPVQTSAPVVSTSFEKDDFGTPALVVAQLDDGGTVRIAVGSAVPVEADRHDAGAVPAAEAAASGGVPGADAALTGTAAAQAATLLGIGEPDWIPAEESTPEGVIADVAAAHPGNAKVQRVAARLAKGLNMKSGSNLQDVRDLAHILFVDVDDPQRALTVAELITDLPFDGNFGRWKWIESCLAIAAHITRQAGDTQRSEAYAAALRVPDDAETDPLKAKLNAQFRQRQLNEPNLYDREIGRAVAHVDKKTEKDWRLLRLGTLMYLRAHGGSQTLNAAELDRRINNELVAVRGLTDQH